LSNSGPAGILEDSDKVADVRVERSKGGVCLFGGIARSPDRANSRFGGCSGEAGVMMGQEEGQQFAVPQSKGKSDRNAIAVPINNAREGETLGKAGLRKRGLWR